MKLKTIKKSTVKHKVCACTRIDNAERAKRLDRMEAYVKKTHQTFLFSLQLAEDMQILGNGALSEPVNKRSKERRLVGV
jgi:hypothetical protein